METILLTIHIILVVALVLVILVQRTSSDGLSGLGGGAAAGAVFSARGSANFLTRATSILATGFICTSLGLAYLASHHEGSSIADKIVTENSGVKTAPAQGNIAVNPTATPATTVPAAVKDEAPAVPVAQ